MVKILKKIFNIIIIPLWQNTATALAAGSVVRASAFSLEGLRFDYQLKTQKAKQNKTTNTNNSSTSFT